MAIQDDLIAAQLALFKDPEAGDVVITCDDRVWRCHSDTLAQRCDFFKAILQSGFKETETKSIELPEDDPDGVEMLLSYLYTLETPEFDCMDDAQRAFVVGDKYDCPHLRNTGLSCLALVYIPQMLYQNNLHDEDKRIKAVQKIIDMWEYSLPAANRIRQCILDKLVNVSHIITPQPEFRRFLIDNADFNFAFVDTLSRAYNGTTDRGGRGRGRGRGGPTRAQRGRGHLSLFGSREMGHTADSTGTNDDGEGRSTAAPGNNGSPNAFSALAALEGADGPRSPPAGT